MKVCYADAFPRLTEDEDAIFLAGPTPRSASVPSWRPEALQILHSLRYEGAVFVPERCDGMVKSNDEEQTEWEYGGLLHSRVIVIWVPRDMVSMPALTTNVEFGYWVAKAPERVVYGRPEGAVNTKYLDWLYLKSRVGRKWVEAPHWFDAGKWMRPESTLDGTLKTAVEMTRFAND